MSFQEDKRAQTSGPVLTTESEDEKGCNACRPKGSWMLEAVPLESVLSPTTSFFWAWAGRTGREAVMPEVWACWGAGSLWQGTTLKSGPAHPQRVIVRGARTVASLGDSDAALHLGLDLPPSHLPFSNWCSFLPSPLLAITDILLRKTLKCWLWTLLQLHLLDKSNNCYISN